MGKKAMAVAAALVAFLLAAGVGVSEGAVYQVGDAAGWTIQGNPNYTAWAMSKKFDVGDIVLFTYNSNFHDVLEVSKANYNACNGTSPIATHTTGNDSITIKTKGHHYFICGFPGHCDAGQKVDIKVSKSSAAPSPSPVAPPPATSPTASPSSGHGGGGSGGISTPAATPKPNTGTRAVPKALAVVLALLSFGALWWTC